MKSLEQRVQALEDIQSIITLKTAYLDAANGGFGKLSHEGTKIANMFTEDGHWELTKWAIAKGRTQIRDTFDKWTVEIPFAVHMVANPRIEVEGDSATGKWNIMAFSRHTGGDKYKGEDLMSLAIYNNEFVRQGGQWLFKKLHAQIILQGPFRSQSWADCIVSSK